VWRVPLFGQTPGYRGPSRLGLGRIGIWLQLSGGTGPDGMAMAADGSIVVAHVGLGSLWVFDRFGEPIRRVRCAEGFRCTNVAFGGPRGTTLYITEADSGAVQTAELDIPGHPLFSHAD
jgi:gluconolactonase